MVVIRVSGWDTNRLLACNEQNGDAEAAGSRTSPDPSETHVVLVFQMAAKNTVMLLGVCKHFAQAGTDVLGGVCMVLTDHLDGDG